MKEGTVYAVSIPVSPVPIIVPGRVNTQYCEYDGDSADL